MQKLMIGSALLGATALMVIGCAPAKWAELSSPLSNSSSGSPVNSPSTQSALETFQQDSTANKVDILIINDNSASMDPEQRKMSERFASFVSELNGIDYRIAMTTTDVDSTKWNQDGRILPWIGYSASRVLTPKTPNASDIFRASVARPETIGCSARKDCPSGNEQPLKALERAMAQAKTANRSFFRTGVDFVTLVLSDEDEMSTAPVGSTTAEDVIAHFKTTFGLTKRFAVHGLIIEPGDDKCKAEQAAQPASLGYAAYGTRVAALAALTGGTINSICDSDYSKDLQTISGEVRKLVSSFELRGKPAEGSVSVTFTPAFKTKWTVSGNRIAFDPAPPPGTKFEVSYRY